MTENTIQNQNLNRARRAPNDEFYTQLSDIENELLHYKPHFVNKVIMCNCDDPRVSNFFRYFAHQFGHLQINKLITTCYKSQSMDMFSRHDCERGLSLEYIGDRDINRAPDADEICVKELQSDGDFRSAECVALLDQAEVVATNPPFSLFREYVGQLLAHNKKFIIIGNMNAITYKDVFAHIKNNEMWLGNNSVKEFLMPNGETKKFGNVIWFTNLTHKKRNEKIILFRRYDAAEYPHYDNYDAINVDKVVDIPCDYDGVMGVPISFLAKYNPNQFEIIGLAAGNIQGLAGIPSSTGKDGPYIKGKLRYGRVLIKRVK